MSDLLLSELTQPAGAQSIPGLLSIIRTTAASLDTAHRNGTVHGNLSPAHILLTGEGERWAAHAADFGSETPVQDSLTSGAPPPDTAYYMSPEKILGSPVSGKSDQFSLGAIAYELLCGSKPFEAPNLPALFHRICTKQPEGTCPGLDPAAYQVLNRALAKNPEDRFPNCADFAEALNEALGQTAPVRPATSRVAAAAAGRTRGPFLQQQEQVDTAKRPRSETPPASGREAGIDDTVLTDTYNWPNRNRRHTYDPGEAEEEASSHSRTFKWALALLVFVVAGFFGLRWFVLNREQPPRSETAANPAPTLPADSAQTSPKVPAQPPPQSGATTPANAGPKPTSPPTSTTTALNRSETPARTTVTPSQRSSVQPLPADLHPRRSGPSAASTASTLPAYLPRVGGTPSPSDPTAVASVELLSTPPSAKITVDSRPDLSCRAPCTLSLANGRHTLTAELDGFAIARKIFNVPEDNSLFISLVKGLGTLVLSSQPQGATVRIDGNESGTTPLTVRLSAGNHRIEMIRGAQQHNETIEIQADNLQTRAYSW